MTLIEILIEKGGLMIYPLLLASLATLWLCLLIPFFMRTNGLFPKGTREKWQGRLNSSSLPDVQSKGDIIILQLIKNRSDAEHTLHHHIEDALTKLRFKLEWPLSGLETLAGISPLLGLTGTVMGIMKIFSGQNFEAINAINLSSGISEALLTTLFGLLIAVPCLIAVSFGQRALNSLLLKSEAFLLELFNEKSEIGN